MRLEKNTEEKYTTVKLLEEKLDSIISPKLKSEFVVLSTNGSKNIILNMEAVRHADSSGLSAMLTGNRICNNIGGVFVLCHLNAHVEKIIKISQLDSILNILPTEQEAIEAVFMYELEQDIEGEIGESHEGGSEAAV